MLPRGVRCPIPGNIQGQAGWGSEQCGPVGDVLSHCGEVGTRLSLSSIPTQDILWFHDSCVCLTFVSSSLCAWSFLDSWYCPNSFFILKYFTICVSQFSALLFILFLCFHLQYYVKRLFLISAKQALKKRLYCGCLLQAMW